MIHINLAVILLYGMLAILSRKHFSKYKKTDEHFGVVTSLFLSMGYTVYHWIEKYYPINRVCERLRKVQIVPQETLRKLAEDYAVKNAAVGLAIFFVCSLASFTYAVTDECRADKMPNIIEREDYQGNTKKQDIYLTVDGETLVYELPVHPMEYSEEEFIHEAEAVRDWLEITILNGNTDALNIREDLQLPERDEKGLFTIEWRSQNPDIITSFGKVDWDLLSEDVQVMLVARVEYLDYFVLFEFPLILRSSSDDIKDDRLHMVRETLTKLEKDNRSCVFWELPEEIDGVEISLGREHGKKSWWLFLAGGALCIGGVLLRRSRLDEAIKRRNEELNSQYPDFVNRLCMLLGTGLTLRGCMEQATRELSEDSILRKELLYMVHELSTGGDENRAYDEFGARIGMPAYTRLANRLNQNLRTGTGDLIRVLEEEVQFSLESKREYMKKRGEEVSTKLLFPMVVLLLVVMLIIILPAMRGL